MSSFLKILLETVFFEEFLKVQIKNLGYLRVLIFA